LDISPNFLCIEKDLKMQPHLLAFLEPENIMWADVLEAEIDFSNTPHLVVGNLPYYITSPIFRKFFVDQTDALG
jgi:16S rRNA A1518/A1519 N6-dimethyltransferase RsmA/KsgA/DIM1 with predicted DNA glycosylase/AP lyase activity